jgi:2-methylisocitrate lyase-like PEP mutase family enzyme
VSAATQTKITQAEKGRIFRALHERDRAFIIPNPWDIGSARLLAHAGFEALATTSAGYAFSVGKTDNTITRDEMIAHVASIAAATNLPINADLENGYGDSPEEAAETIRLAGQAGACGGSIEDATGKADHPIYDLAQAADRIRAAAEAARALPFTFTLTARAENYLNGHADLKDTIKRLQAYQEAGANVLYAPGLTSKEDIAAVVSSVDRPVNVLAGLANAPLTLADLSALEVKRVSIGSLFSRAAYGAAIRAANEMRERGTFTFADQAVSFRDLTAVFKT